MTEEQQIPTQILRGGSPKIILIIIGIVILLGAIGGGYYWGTKTPKSTSIIANPVRPSETESASPSSESASPPSPQSSGSLPKSESIPAPPVSITPTRIDRLASIRISGGIWENWDADSEKDGPFIDVVYLNNKGEIIANDQAENLPISADVKLYTAERSSALSRKKGRLIFSARYSANQIIFGRMCPRIRIPKEEISVNPSIDYRIGYVSITIHTPEQGDFSDENDFVVLYE